jgi:hypothetical protein
MGTIDIRSGKPEEIREIRWKEGGTIERYSVNNVVAYGCDIYSLEDAQHLIKAVEKAIELGWFE